MVVVYMTPVTTIGPSAKPMSGRIAAVQMGLSR
jgi:hypothetical protein